MEGEGHSLARDGRGHLFRDTLITCISPLLWGSIYIVTTEFLPANHPFMVGMLRSLPLGLILVALHRRLPSGIWWWRSLVLGAVNIGLFAALSYEGAYRLPGGVASTIGATQTFVVAFMAWLLLRQRLSLRTLLTATAGVVGVGMLVLGPEARLDTFGIVAAAGATLFMSTGTVLIKRWGPPVPLVVYTSWQLVTGGLILGILALIFELPFPGLTVRNIGGLFYASVFVSGLALVVWVRGIGKLRVVAAAFIALIGPLVATLLGYIFLNQTLTLIQVVGALIILGSVVAEQLNRPPLPGGLA